MERLTLHQKQTTRLVKMLQKFWLDITKVRPATGNGF